MSARNYLSQWEKPGSGSIANYQPFYNYNKSKASYLDTFFLYLTMWHSAYTYFRLWQEADGFHIPRRKLFFKGQVAEHPFHGVLTLSLTPARSNNLLCCIPQYTYSEWDILRGIVNPYNTEMCCVNHGDERFCAIWNHHKCLSAFENLWYRSTTIINSWILSGDRLTTSESNVYLHWHS